MLNVGEDRARSRRSNVPLTWVCDDAEVLGEQADNSFDAYTISFGSVSELRWRWGWGGECDWFGTVEAIG